MIRSLYMVLLLQTLVVFQQELICWFGVTVCSLFRGYIDLFSKLTLVINLIER